MKALLDLPLFIKTSCLTEIKNTNPDALNEFNYLRFGILDSVDDIVSQLQNLENYSDEHIERISENAIRILQIGIQQVPWLNGTYIVPS